MIVKLLTAFSFLMCAIPIHAQIFSPSNYEDCVLQGLKEAKTEAAVTVLMGICSSKFTKTEKPLDKRQEVPAVCLLYWDGIKTTKLTSTPKDWRKNFSAFSISKYNMEFAIIYVPKSFTQTKDADAEMWQLANIWCK